MIRVVINNLKPRQDHRFIFICQDEHIKKYGLKEKLRDWAPGSEIIGINGLTEGAACTVLYAKDLISNNDPLMIANSDQYIDANINEYLSEMRARGYDGQIMTMKANDPKWSFVGLNSQQLVEKVVEKQVISDEATVGIYNFARGVDFVEAAQEMIDKNLRVNNEFYVAPAYNQMIKKGSKIGIYNIGSEANGMYGLGIPIDLEFFLTQQVLKKATQIKD